MRMTLLAATLLALPAALLLGQSGVSPNNPGAVGIAKPSVPSPTPTRATGAAAFSAAAGQVKPPSPALHLDAQIRHLGCGTPLEFEVVVSNRGIGAFSGGADLHVSGPPLNEGPNGGFVRVGVPALAPGASQTFHLKAPPPVKVDCVAPRKFLATLTPGANLIQPHPQWDREAVEVTTTPPTNCSATSGFRHLRGWDPRT